MSCRCLEPGWVVWDPTPLAHDYIHAHMVAIKSRIMKIAANVNDFCNVPRPGFDSRPGHMTILMGSYFRRLKFRIWHGVLLMKGSYFKGGFRDYTVFFYLLHVLSQLCRGRPLGIHHILWSNNEKDILEPFPCSIWWLHYSTGHLVGDKITFFMRTDDSYSCNHAEWEQTNFFILDVLGW